MNLLAQIVNLGIRKSVGETLGQKPIQCLYLADMDISVVANCSIITLKT